MGIPENEAEEAQAARDRDLPPAAEADQRRATAAAQEPSEEDVAATPGLDTSDVEELAVDGEIVDEDGSTRLATKAEVEQAVEEAMSSLELTPVSRDKHEGLVAMDAHDAIRFVDRLVEQAQRTNLGKRWVYQLPGAGGDGLTVDAVEDITQQMNWTGRCRITLLPDTKHVEVVEADEGRGLEKFWVCDIFAEDEITGQKHMGSSMEPMYMQLTKETANKKRAKGQAIPDDDRIFDRFARTKAANKAARNAEEKHIPEIVKLTLIAMAKNKPQMIERIETQKDAEAQAWPPPATGPEADALNAEIDEIYARIRELGGGRGKVELTPGVFHGYKLQAAHDVGKLESMKLFLLEREEQIAAKFGEEVER